MMLSTGKLQSDPIDAGVPNGRRSARSLFANWFATEDIVINGTRPWDLLVHDERLWSRALAGGTLAVGEAYIEGWWDCVQLDEFLTRAMREFPPLFLDLTG